MASRGEVFRLRRRVGFIEGPGEESVVIVQATPLNHVLPTVLAAPVDDALPEYERSPMAIPVSADELGSAREGRVLLWALRPVARTSLQALPSGRLGPATEARLDHALGLLVGLLPLGG